MNPASEPLSLWFARHGATAPNLLGIRCGGDIDPPLAPQGREQALALAHRFERHWPPIEVLVCSDLARTLETAKIVQAALGATTLRIEPGFRERRLGEWNLRPVADTEPALAAGETPPGGEARAVFDARIRAAFADLLPTIARRRVLLVASKGVARVLRELAGSRASAGPLAPLAPLGNAECIELQFDAARFAAPPAAAAPDRRGRGLDRCPASLA